MNTFGKVRSIATFAAGVAGVFVLQSAAVAQTGPERQELDWAVGEQPQVVLSRSVIESAGAYKRHLAELGQAKVRRVANSPEQLARGATAYGATIALKDPTFTASVRWLAADPMARKRVAARMLQNPEAALRFDRTGSAAKLIGEAMPNTADSAMLSRSLALAAMAVLGEAGDDNAAALETLLKQPCAAGECLYAQR